MGEPCFVSSGLLFLLAKVKFNVSSRIWNDYFMAIIFDLWWYPFIFIRILWRNMEGKTIQYLTQDLTNPVLKDDERRKQLARLVDYLTVSKVQIIFYGKKVNI